MWHIRREAIVALRKTKNVSSDVTILARSALPRFTGRIAVANDLGPRDDVAI